MPRTVENWSYAAEDAYTHLVERKRDYPKEKMLAVIDHLCVSGTVARSDLIAIHAPADLVSTSIGHVTTAVHGKGSVPKQGGWYRTSENSRIYHVEPEFAAAWVLRRRLKR